MDRVLFTCPACRGSVPGPPSLQGAASPCPKCGSHVARWPAPQQSTTQSPPQPDRPRSRPTPPPPPSSTAQARTPSLSRVSQKWVVGIALSLLVIFVAVGAYQLGRGERSRAPSREPSQAADSKPVKESQPNLPTIPPRKAASGISTIADLRASALGEQITITGKIGIGMGGIRDMIRFPDEPVPPTIDPLFYITLRDGTDVVCAFEEMSREVYIAWLKKNPPGTAVSVSGIYWKGTPLALTHCTVLPDGFR